MVNRVMRSMRLAGASVAVVKDERLVYAKGFGFLPINGRKGRS